LKEENFKVNVDEIIENFNLNITKAIFLIESEEQKQMAKFEDSRKRRMFVERASEVYLKVTFRGRGVMSAEIRYRMILILLLVN
jgi:siroheme synthase (precorrin-2 oxidase/ferrochelatase)